jgi:hypothetical protein
MTARNGTSINKTVKVLDKNGVIVTVAANVALKTRRARHDNLAIVYPAKIRHCLLPVTTDITLLALVTGITH